jgi:hypothetical protein
MTRLTKAEIESKLCAGMPVSWTEVSGKKSELALGDAKSRNLFTFILKSSNREPTGLSADFVNGLWNAYSASSDPASAAAAEARSSDTLKPWRLQSIESEGFGGLNIWGGPLFRFDLDGASYLIEGPNGSGKSSLIGAILWACAGERPRDQSDGDPHDPKAVFGADNRSVGTWPPIAAYPPSIDKLPLGATLHVTLTFVNEDGETATLTREFDKGRFKELRDAKLLLPPILN